MTTETMKFPIPNEVLEPYIREAVSTSIVGALGDGTELIQKAVQKALSEKVDCDGNISRYPDDNKYPFVEILAGKKIREIAKETINEMAEKMRPQIQREMEKQLRENQSEIVRAMVDGLIDGLDSHWGVTLKLKQ